MVNEPNAIEAKPRPRRTWRWWLLRAAIAVLLVVGLGLGWHFYQRHLADEQLRRVVEALDRTDPRWRLHEIEADRAEIPEEANGALQVLAARAEMPLNWRAPVIDPQWKQVSLPQRLDEKTAQAYRTERDMHPAALERARRMTNFDHGRYPSLTIAPDVFSTLMPHLEKAQVLKWLLGVDAVLLAHDGDTSTALRSCRALVNVGASIGDEPILISQVIRMAAVEDACRATERALAQGEATDAELALLQKRLRAEDGEDLHSPVARGDRASLHQIAEGIESGAFSMWKLFEGKSSAPSWGDRASTEWRAIGLRVAHRRGLEQMTEYVAITQLPLAERPERLATLEAAVRSERSMYAGLFLLSKGKWLETIQRHHANLRILQVALAAERYRLKHGVWPISAEVLVPTLLERVPDDPYTGAPIRFVWRDGGVLIYCLGADRHDDRGTFDRERPTAPGSDVGVQLWPVSQRGRKAPALPNPR